MVHNSPKHETKRHRLLSPDPIHEEATNYASGEVETIDYSAVANVLDKGVVRV